MVEHPLRFGSMKPTPHVLRLSWHHTISASKIATVPGSAPAPETVELLDAQEMDVVHPALLALLVEIVMTLPEQSTTRPSRRRA
jgi:hypothetical protein